jgi:D-alanyl-D-alanine carboxypeptidase
MPIWAYVMLFVTILPIPLLAFQMWQSPAPQTASVAVVLTPTPSGGFFADFPVSQTTPVPQDICSAPPSFPLQRCDEGAPKRLDRFNACFGHLPYPEAPRGDLVSVGQELLRSSAARKFQEMRAVARQAGVRMNDLSGFRSIETQRYLFYEIARQRGQNLAQRSRVSAPPGYSEHHTGYAIDIGDGDAPGTDLSESFAGTRAYSWLAQNARTYGFELSFERNNVQGVLYEPWHWRFVGDADSQKLFAVARQCLNTKS